MDEFFFKSNFSPAKLIKHRLPVVIR